MKEAGNILIVKLSSIGDVVHSLPFLEVVRNNGVIEKLKERIRNHLVSAASIAADCGMNGMGSELQALLAGI